MQAGSKARQTLTRMYWCNFISPSFVMFLKFLHHTFHIVQLSSLIFFVKVSVMDPKKEATLLKILEEPEQEAFEQGILRRN